jgi:O-succinylbenzoic acid--CoA ligase
MNQFIHPDFKLNGKSFTYIELLSEAIYLKENGALFEKAIGKFLLEWLNNRLFLFRHLVQQENQNKLLLKNLL